MTSVSTRLDKAAIGISTLCLVHCLLLPVALVLLPSASILATLSDEIFHLGMIVVVLPTSIIALTLGCRRHRAISVVALGTVGLTILVLAALFGHDLLGEAGEKIVTIVGACFVAAGHLQNFRLCQKLECSA